MRRFYRAITVLGLITTAASAQQPNPAQPNSTQPKPTRFWNLTLHTVTHLRMSPAGQNAWGPDQCANDRDGDVDHDERLRITGVAPGRYDIKLSDSTGRICVVRNVDIVDGGVFSVEEKQMTSCAQ